MEWLFERLEQEEAAERRRLESLRAQVAASEERLARFTITRETALALRDDDPGQDDPVDDPSARSAGGERARGLPAADDGGGSRSERPEVAGAGCGPAQHTGPLGDRRKLTGVNEQVVVLLAGAGRAMRAKEIAVAMGEPDRHGRVEGMRTRLKRLVATGWLAEPDRGLFSIASGVNGSGVNGSGVNGSGVNGSGVNGVAREGAAETNG